MPFLYFNILNKQYPKSLIAAPYGVAKLVDQINNILWGNMEKTKENLKYRYFGIPPQYAGDAVEFTAKKEVKDTLEAICKNVEKFLSTGVLLYIHSPYETSAIIAGSKLCKAASVVEGKKWLMLAYPEFVDGTKDFSGAYQYKLDAAESVDLLCMYMVGKEYATEFTLAGLKSLLMNRKVAGKVTVLTSHLTAEEFGVRYGSELCITALECSDEKELNNFKALRRLVEG